MYFNQILKIHLFYQNERMLLDFDSNDQIEEISKVNDQNEEMNWMMRVIVVQIVKMMLNEEHNHILQNYQYSIYSEFQFDQHYFYL